MKNMYIAIYIIYLEFFHYNMYIYCIEFSFLTIHLMR